MEDRKAIEGFSISDLGFRIADLRRHRAWGMGIRRERREKREREEQKAGSSWQQAARTQRTDDRSQMSEVRG